MPTVAELAERFMAEHIEPKRRAGTVTFYRHILDRIVKPRLGAAKADKVTRAQIAKLHSQLQGTPFHANRMLAVVGSMYAFGARIGVVPEGVNPARKIIKYPEHRRERFLTTEELERLGAAIHEAETTGIPYEIDTSKPTAKHAPKEKNRIAQISLFAAAALRLLLFTGCRLREILHLKWEHVDFERGLLFLPESKTGKKTVILNAPALEVLNALDRVGSYVVPGDDPDKPRADLKRPWAAVAKRAGLDGVRLHDLRHTYASFGRAVASGCRSSASCSATRRHRPPNVTRTSTAIRSGGPPNTSVVVSLRRWKGNEAGPSYPFAGATNGWVYHGPAPPETAHDRLQCYWANAEETPAHRYAPLMCHLSTAPRAHVCPQPEQR